MFSKSAFFLQGFQLQGLQLQIIIRHIHASPFTNSPVTQNPENESSGMSQMLTTDMINRIDNCSLQIKNRSVKKMQEN